MKVLFKVKHEEQIAAMQAVLSEKETFGDDISVSTIDNGSFDLVINVKATYKDTCLIFDHSGSIHRLGYPDDIDYDELPSKDDGMKEVNSAREQERREKTPKECTSCHYMKPVGVYACPKCGFKPLAGEDVEVDTSRNIKKISKTEKVYTQKEKQSWWSQLKYYQNVRAAKGKPVSDGWVSNTYRDKFAVWPQGLHDTPQEITPEVSNFIKHKQIAWAKSRKKAAEQISTLRTQISNIPQQGALL